ncbi:hypothetical protein [Pedobacter endophyticus]|uniref:Uncharacterized protein n=1 Tax=Pedobacter endophyticus TaxID=2789740 RepID=A0A7S9L1X8_9SPHI|nr:hypothetical protein [Pedobacter endophyticus]QPH41004.1 hypothetical protein IZT61_07025 [Pedobacter endophyticus]
MKKKWLISVKDDAMDKVADALQKMGALNIERLDSIGVIMIMPENQDIADVRKIDGVSNVDEENDVSI